MAFVRVPFARGKELPLAKRGTYELVIREFQVKEAKSGRQYFRVKFGFTNGEHPAFVQNFFCPLPDDKPEMADRFARETRRFFKLFEIEIDEAAAEEEQGFDPEKVIGATAKAFVLLDTDTDQDGSEVEVNKIVAPRSKD